MSFCGQSHRTVTDERACHACTKIARLRAEREEANDLIPQLRLQLDKAEAEVERLNKEISRYQSENWVRTAHDYADRLHKAEAVVRAAEDYRTQTRIRPSSGSEEIEEAGTVLDTSIATFRGRA